MVETDAIQVVVAWVDVDIQDEHSNDEDEEEAHDRTMEGTWRDDRDHLRGEVDDEDGLPEVVVGSNQVQVVRVGSGDAGGASGGGTAAVDARMWPDGTVLHHPRVEEVAVRELMVQLQSSASFELAEVQQQSVSVFKREGSSRG